MISRSILILSGWNLDSSDKPANPAPKSSRCCASLEIAVIAEGVEKAEEWMWLEAVGVSQFQGMISRSILILSGWNLDSSDKPANPAPKSSSARLIRDCACHY
jgi:EAL domain-containing protein (putative c-di-GMP-specific phosphodiesterase class I)